MTKFFSPYMSLNTSMIKQVHHKQDEIFSWKYEDHRVKFANQVAEIQKNSKKTEIDEAVRKKMRELKTRQVIQPPLGHLTDLLFPCALHISLLAASNYLGDFVYRYDHSHFYNTDTQQLITKITYFLRQSIIIHMF